MYLKDEDLLPSPLQNWLKRGSCIAFVGAGFSMPLGFPSWSQLMLNLLTYVEENVYFEGKERVLEMASEQINSGNLTAAAGQLKKRLSKSDFSSFYREQFSVRVRENQASEDQKERMRKRLDNLARANWAGIVTTNLDDSIRDGRFDWRLSGSDPDLGHILSRRDPFLVKLHSVEWQNDGILTDEDYFETYLPHGKNLGVREFLKALTLTHQLVFIGCSLEGRILDVRREMHQAFKGSLPNAWALVPDTPLNRSQSENLLQEHDIKLILYPKENSPYPSHWCVDRFLELSGAIAS